MELYYGTNILKFLGTHEFQGQDYSSETRKELLCVRDTPSYIPFFLPKHMPKMSDLMIVSGSKYRAKRSSTEFLIFLQKKPKRTSGKSLQKIRYYTIFFVRKATIFQNQRTPVNGLGPMGSVNLGPSRAAC